MAHQSGVRWQKLAELLFPFITYHWTMPLPMSWQTTSFIHRQHPACGPAGCSCQVLLETSCAGGAESFLCHQLAQEEVFGYGDANACHDRGEVPRGWRQSVIHPCSVALIVWKHELVPERLRLDSGDEESWQDYSNRMSAAETTIPNWCWGPA